MKKSRQASSGKKSSQSKKQSSLTKQKLVDFLVRAAEVERKLEIVKEMLAEEETFTPASLFHRLDEARKGFITEKDVNSFMREQKVDLKGSEVKMLFGRINAVKTEEAVRARE
jgi:Ca2+-binding EF-hand superfamily protein